jgi:hypothetical protein
MKNLVFMDIKKTLVIVGCVVVLGLTLVLGFQYGKAKVSESEDLTSEEHRRVRSSGGGLNGNRFSKVRVPAHLTIQGESPEWMGVDFLTRDQMKTAVEDIARCQDPLQQDFLFSHCLTKITADSVESYWQTFKEHSSGSQDDLRRLSLVSYTWGLLHGETAVRFALTENTPENRLLARHAIEGWAAESPERALAFMQSEEGFKAQSCRFGLLKGLARSDPGAAASYLVELDSFTDARPYLKPVLDSQIRVDFDGAQSWVMSLPSAKLQEQGLLLLAKRMALKTPEEAMGWLDTFSQDPVTAGAVSVITAKFMGSSENEQQNIDFTLNWIRGLSGGETKNRAYESSLRSWSKRDATAAAEHLNTLDASPERDSAVRGFSLEVAKKYPEVAVRWAATIEDPAVRHRTLILAGKAWIRRDSEAADTWMEHSNLEEKTLIAIKEKN